MFYLYNYACLCCKDNDFCLNSYLFVVKYFITISKEEQLKRFEDRKANKPWKITDEDWRNRERWDDYLKATGTMLNLTNKDNAPWIVIPNNNKYFGRLEVLKSLINIIEKKLK